MPASPDQLTERVVELAARLDAFLARCEAKAATVEEQLDSHIRRLTGHLARAAEDLSHHARAAAEPRNHRDLWILFAGVVMGLLIAAVLWRPFNGSAFPRVPAILGQQELVPDPSPHPWS